MSVANMELTCIRCPMGCRLSVQMKDGAFASVTGNSCRRGAEYAATESTAPVRTVTTTIRLLGGERPVVSVKTVPDVPKDRIFDVMAAVRAASAQAPVHIGDILLRDVAGTGSDIVATSSLGRVSG